MRKTKIFSVCLPQHIYDFMKKKAREIAIEENKDCSIQKIVNKLLEEYYKSNMEKK